MHIFLLVIILFNGEGKYNVQEFGSLSECEDTKVEVVASLQSLKAEIVKAECIVSGQKT